MQYLSAFAHIAVITIAFIAFMEFFQRRAAIKEAKKKCSCTDHANPTGNSADINPSATPAPYAHTL